MISVVLADDETMVRAGLKLLLRAESDIAMVAEAADGEQALTALAEHRPDVLLLDLHMPRLDGPGVLRALRAVPEAAGGTRVLVLTTFDGDEHLFPALHAGAAGYLLKSSPPDELLRGIRACAAGETVLSPRVAGRVVARMLQQDSALAGHTPASAEAALAGLTDQERAVLDLLTEGLPNAAIGERLGLSVSTVKTYASRVNAKLGVTSRLQAALLLQRLRSG
ncbi:response regulator transcription factor [Kitasatospora sp. NPDC091276]|uniref:response regulator transcription factor n=1 Tax=Kitasatospora sp. NPDC091276 TaxID=3155300 RepID=UPI00341916F6